MRLGPVAFFGIVTLLFTAVHTYLWWRLVRDTTRPGRWRRVGTAAVVAAALLAPVTFVVTRSVGVDAGWLAWPGYVWIAVLLYLTLALLVLEVPRAVLRIRAGRRAAVPSTEPPVPVGSPTRSAGAGSPVSAPPDGPVSARSARHSGGAGPSVPDPGRRLFLARALAAGAGVVAVGTVGAGMASAFGGLRVDRAAVRLPRLDPRLDGFRIAVVGDVHLGPFMRQGFAERVVETVNRERPDVVAIVGDLVDGTVDELRHAVEPIRRLRADGGVYFVTGNHEYSSGAAAWLDEIGGLGIRTLRNSRVEITANGAAFDLAGVNDPSAALYEPAEVPDYAAALGGRDESRPVVLLAHQPVQANEASRFGVDLQLSGHTHGGQTVPVDRVTGILQPVVAGLGAVNSTQVYVTRGAGFFGPPVRAGVSPEVSLVELRSAR
ncbi:metallophosphoesterase [Plantactinospora sp. S1510]|uniref:Metallophosphoesterase n=1 Tax=Plantactinospora alkalitolerans TaxID=2789879 RepID=A0ABS0H7L0_9ACTN|nr:metallophosphoesterase [Plantactinospora alkalitolerans]MBF9134458.1 metallophosphoesterase [Plantactinospora alkalitolerans]